MTRSIAELVAEAQDADVDGWDFSFLDGRAREQRPSWGYARLLRERMSRVDSALDLQTGGGEVLAEVPVFPPVTVATEGWPPNLVRARRLLGARGVTIVDCDGEAPLPFDADAFHLVVSRHPTRTVWSEVARVLRPGGVFLSQQIGPNSLAELQEVFLGPALPGPSPRDPAAARAGAQAAGLVVDDLRVESLPVEFDDVGAIVYFLRKVVWTVPGFSVEMYRPELADLHEQMVTGGPFWATATRFLIEAHRPA